MRRMIFIAVVCLMTVLEAKAQQPWEIELIAAFLGAESEESLSEDEVEKMVGFLRRPVKVNLLSRSALVSSGLFTSYQTASLLDYRMRHGEVLSFSELALVDGFGERYVQSLKPFVSLDLSGGPCSPRKDSVKLRNELSLKGGYRFSFSERDWQYGLKYVLDDTRRLQASAGLARNRSAKSPLPSSYTVSVSWDFIKADARLVVGDFHARFGQGLVAWSGASIGGVVAPSGFMKKASGISAVRSFTGSTANTGIAAEVGIGKYALSAAMALPGVKDWVRKSEKPVVAPLLNVRRWMRFGTVGLTTYADLALGSRYGKGNVAAKSSVDAAICIGGVNLFGEAAYAFADKKCSLVTGTDFSPIESLRLAALTGWRQSRLWQFAMSGEVTPGQSRNHKGLLFTEVLYHLEPKDAVADRWIQVKSQLRWEWDAMEHLVLRIRFSDRFRTWGIPHRAEGRFEAEFPLGEWTLCARVNMLKCRGISLLGCFDASCSSSLFTFHFRMGAFKADHWDDRIYVYEYDAPGNFNVPAYYGRGVWTAGVLSMKLSRAFRLYVRASSIAYPFDLTQKKKPGRTELKFQTVFRF